MENPYGLTEFLKVISEIVEHLSGSEDYLSEMPKVLNLRLEVIRRHRELSNDHLQRIHILLKFIDDAVRDKLNIERLERLRH